MIWALSFGMALGVTIMILRGFMIASEGAKSSELDVQVYKDQLKALDSDLERGVLGDDEAAAAKLEISRRLLAADRRLQGEVSANVGTVSKSFMIAVAAMLLGGSYGLYAYLGSPYLPDQPLEARIEADKIARSNRPDQVQAEGQIEAVIPKVDAEYLELIETLRETMKTNTGDLEGWQLLALHEGRIGNMRSAWRAKEQVIALLGGQVSGEDYTDLAEYMIFATNGYVSTNAEAALSKALQLNAKLPRARYYSGLALAQNGRPDVAYRMWIGLLEEGPDDAPWIRLIRGQIGGVARAAGIDTVDQDAPGPNEGDMQAAEDMSDEDRKTMIRGMVSGLAERLGTDGGTPAEWARLIRAYGVLGETGNASAIWNEARETFADDANAMAILLEAAQAAEVSN